MTMEVDGHPNSETGPSDKEPGPSPASPWVSTPTDGQNNITTYEPSAESERKSVRTYAGRVESFKLNRWNAKLTKSQTTNPQKMAEIGWFCTGTKDAKCFACFKDLEGWEPKDSPKEEHGKHCPKCPLTVLNISPTSALTFRQMLRLDAAIEYYRKKLITAKQWNKLKDQHEEELNLLVRAIAKIRKENTALLDSDEAEL